MTILAGAWTLVHCRPGVWRRLPTKNIWMIILQGTILAAWAEENFTTMTPGLVTPDSAEPLLPCAVWRVQGLSRISRKCRRPSAWILCCMPICWLSRGFPCSTAGMKWGRSMIIRINRNRAKQWIPVISTEADFSGIWRQSVRTRKLWPDRFSRRLGSLWPSGAGRKSLMRMRIALWRMQAMMLSCVW